jgi:hypothetical protein
MPVQKRFCHSARARGERDPPHPWPGDMENGEPELKANVDIVFSFPTLAILSPSMITAPLSRTLPSPINMKPPTNAVTIVAS